MLTGCDGAGMVDHAGAGPRSIDRNRDSRAHMEPPSERDSGYGRPWLNAITVSGFKSAREPVRVRLGDLTVLAGPNSAGKSTIMQPLLMLKQTIEKDYETAGLAIDGPLVKFSRVEQFLARLAVGHSSQGFAVTYRHVNVDTTFHYATVDDGPFGLSSIETQRDGRTATWRLGDIISEADARFASGWIVRGRISEAQEGADRYKVERIGPRLVARRLSDDAGDPEIPAAQALSSARPLVAGERSIHDARSLIYLPGLRGNPERSYPIGVGGPFFPGSFNDYAASVIHHWQLMNDPRLDGLSRVLGAIGLARRVVPTRLDDTRVELRVGRLPPAARGGARDTVNIADVGFGVSQTLPVLVALLAAAQGQIVFIEQPELHLHPRAQAALAGPLVAAAKRGVRVVAETHSSALILAIQTLVAKGEIAPEHVSLNWFSRDESGQTRVTEAELGADGSYGDWPSDFDAVELGLHDAYMTEVEKQRA